MTNDGLLDVCDRLLGEVGRRRHLFGWLRVPDSEHWVPVDAYYPGHRLVVVCCDADSAGDELVASRVPEHGLRLLRLAPSVVLADPAGVVGALERELGAVALAPPPPRPRPRPTAAPAGPNPVARAVASLAQPRGESEPHAPPHRAKPSQAEAVARATRFVAAHRTPAPHTGGAATRTRRPSRPRRQSTPRRTRPVRHRRFERQRVARLNPFAGIMLAAAVAAEVYFGVIRWGLDGGHLLLAFGLALDTCARALGTIAAGRADDQSAAWWCALGGTPFVAGFALYGEDGPVEVDPAPLAGLMALFAAIVLVIAVLAAALSG